MKFPYIKIPPSDPRRKWISRPIISITLSGSSGRATVEALIDSGADLSLFHVSLAHRIGINLGDCPIAIFSGIESGKLNAWLHEVAVEIVGVGKSTKFNVGFVDSPGVFAILGQEGFFDHYRIKFERDRDIFEIMPVK